MTHILIEMIKSTLCHVMIQNIDENLLVVGPQEFHFSIAGSMEFTRLYGTETVRRDSIPDRFLPEEWKIRQVDNMDDMLDMYNDIVLNIKDVYHQLVE